MLNVHIMMCVRINFVSFLFLKGSASDGGVYKTSKLYDVLHDQTNPSNIPNDKCIHPNRTKPMPFCIIGDDAFASSLRLMKPIPRQQLTLSERVYNYRLSRARRVVENTFGILSARWRCLRTTLEQHPENVKKIVLAVCILHNLLMKRSRDIYAPEDDLTMEDDASESVDQNDQNVQEIGTIDEAAHPQQYSREFHENRLKEYQEYFVSSYGEIAWQYKQI